MLANTAFSQKYEVRPFIKEYQKTLFITANSVQQLTRSTGQYGRFIFLEGFLNSADEDDIWHYPVNERKISVTYKDSIVHSTACDTVVSCFPDNGPAGSSYSSSTRSLYFSYLLNGLEEEGIYNSNHRVVRIMEINRLYKQNRKMPSEVGIQCNFTKVEILGDSARLSAGSGQSASTKGFYLDSKGSCMIKQKDVKDLIKLTESICFPMPFEYETSNSYFLIEYFDGCKYHNLLLSYALFRNKELSSIFDLYRKVMGLGNIYRKEVVSN